LPPFSRYCRLGVWMQKSAWTLIQVQDFRG
jgi:hypothetical protein